MHQKIDKLVTNMEKIIIGKRSVILRLINAVLCNGHILIEDVPGTGKTQMIIALSNSLNGVFHRIQLTPDVMVSDVVGYSMIDKASHKTNFHPGAVMCNFLLADEINRTSPKVQSSLLEAMEERQVTVDGQTHALPLPFFTFATQNPIESYGTYHLPEAQMDRFIMCISMGYPEPNHEMEIMEHNAGQSENNAKQLQPVLQLEDILQLQKEVDEVRAESNLKAYIMCLVQATRENENISLGVSPRGSIALLKAAKAEAFIHERDYVIPQDVMDVAVDVLSHRIMLSSKGKLLYKNKREFIEEILRTTQVPIEDKNENLEEVSSDDATNENKVKNSLYHSLVQLGKTNEKK